MDRSMCSGLLLVFLLRVSFGQATPASPESPSHITSSTPADTGCSPSTGAPLTMSSRQQTTDSSEACRTRCDSLKSSFPEAQCVCEKANDANSIHGDGLWIQHPASIAAVVGGFFLTLACLLVVATAIAERRRRRDVCPKCFKQFKSSVLGNREFQNWLDDDKTIYTDPYESIVKDPLAEDKPFEPITMRGSLNLYEGIGVEQHPGQCDVIDEEPEEYTVEEDGLSYEEMLSPETPDWPEHDPRPNHVAREDPYTYGSKAATEDPYSFGSMTRRDELYSYGSMVVRDGEYQLSKDYQAAPVNSSVKTFLTKNAKRSLDRDREYGIPPDAPEHDVNSAYSMSQTQTTECYTALGDINEDPQQSEYNSKSLYQCLMEDDEMFIPAKNTVHAPPTAPPDKVVPLSDYMCLTDGAQQPVKAQESQARLGCIQEEVPSYECLWEVRTMPLPPANAHQEPPSQSQQKAILRHSRSTDVPKTWSHEGPTTPPRPHTSLCCQHTCITAPGPREGPATLPQPLRSQRSQLSHIAAPMTSASPSPLVPRPLESQSTYMTAIPPSDGPETVPRPHTSLCCQHTCITAPGPREGPATLPQPLRSQRSQLSHIAAPMTSASPSPLVPRPLESQSTYMTAIPPSDGPETVPRPPLNINQSPRVTDIKTRPRASLPQLQETPASPPYAPPTPTSPRHPGPSPGHQTHGERRSQQPPPGALDQGLDKTTMSAPRVDEPEPSPRLCATRTSGSPRNSQDWEKSLQAERDSSWKEYGQVRPMFTSSSLDSVYMDFSGPTQDIAEVNYVHRPPAGPKARQDTFARHQSQPSFYTSFS